METKDQRSRKFATAILCVMLGTGIGGAFCGLIDMLGSTPPSIRVLCGVLTIMVNVVGLVLRDPE